MHNILTITHLFVVLENHLTLGAPVNCGVRKIKPYPQLPLRQPTGTAVLNILGFPSTLA